HSQRLAAAGAVEGRRQHLDVAPDLALEAAAVAREEPDDLPALALQLDRAADFEPLVAVASLLAGDQLIEPGREIAPLDDLHVLAPRECHRRDAADGDVDFSAVTPLRQGDDHV